MAAYMRIPLDLSCFTSAALQFWYYIPSLETCCDKVHVYIDSTPVWSSRGTAQDWTQATVDLTPYAGRAHLLRFEFDSDLSNNAEGCYLDDILLTAYDQAPPTITCGPTKSVECGEAWSFDQPTVSDNCCTNVTVNVLSTTTNLDGCTPFITRTWEAIDCNGNTNQCNQSIIVTDTHPPQWIGVASKTVICGSVWDFDTPTALDACSGLRPVSVVSTETNGTCPQVLSRTWHAADFCRQSTNFTQIVTVLDPGPSLTCAGDKTVECGSAWSFDEPMASDSCCAEVVLRILGTVTNGACPQQVTRTWMAWDCCGNNHHLHASGDGHGHHASVFPAVSNESDGLHGFGPVQRAHQLHRDGD